ncbi:MAG: nucleotidyltransferase domain-containing protein [Oscillospiraceae bacterium]|nr:nucleotidyltransferase domain-containing protein [Oscillospiraceae bacterium]
MLTHDDIRNAVTHTASVFPIKQAYYFGSYAEGRQTDESDLDLLVEFQKPAVSLFTISALKNALEDLLNISVDVIHAPIAKYSLIQIEKTVQVYG